MSFIIDFMCGSSTCHGWSQGPKPSESSRSQPDGRDDTPRSANSSSHATATAKNTISGFGFQHDWQRHATNDTNYDKNGFSDKSKSVK